MTLRFRSFPLPFGLVALGLTACLGGCGGGREWQSKYEDCRVLAAALASEPSEFIKPPDCERIPRLCAQAPDSGDCRAELAKVRRK